MKKSTEKQTARAGKVVIVMSNATGTGKSTAFVELMDRLGLGRKRLNREKGK